MMRAMIHRCQSIFIIVVCSGLAGLPAHSQTSKLDDAVKLLSLSLAAPIAPRKTINDSDGCYTSKELNSKTYTGDQRDFRVNGNIEKQMFTCEVNKSFTINTVFTYQAKFSELASVEVRDDCADRSNSPKQCMWNPQLVFVRVKCIGDKQCILHSIKGKECHGEAFGNGSCVSKPETKREKMRSSISILVSDLQVAADVQIAVEALIRGNAPR